MLMLHLPLPLRHLLLLLMLLLLTAGLLLLLLPGTELTGVQGCLVCGVPRWWTL
jgi:hypothetical protein